MKKKVLIIVNHELVIYNFRKELVENLIIEGYEVHIISPYGPKIEKLCQMGCITHNIELDRHGTNPIKDLFLIGKYKKKLKEISPDIVLTYTIKPNVYGSIACKIMNIPLIINVTGLGTSIEKEGIIQKISLFMYTIALRNAEVVYFQNQSNYDFFIKRKIIPKYYEILPGSGVNVEEFPKLQYTKKSVITYLFISRIMKDKGIDEFLKVAEIFYENNINAIFYVAGFIDGEYTNVIKESVDKGIITYLGVIDDVREAFLQTDCVVLPSYHEGMSNVLLEASASGVPSIASNIPGCREIIDHQVTGLLVERKNFYELEKAMIDFSNMDYIKRKRMGEMARKKVEVKFNRNIIVEKYLSKIKEILK